MLHEQHLSPEMQRCIQECLNCYRVCLEAAMQHCLEMGGKHVEPVHFRTMIACADICQTSANFMLIGSELHTLTCAACAQVCEACARSCDQVGDMQECAEACSRCSESCRQMAA